MLPCMQLQMWSLHRMLLLPSLCHVGVAVLTLHVVSWVLVVPCVVLWSWSEHHVVLQLWWLSLCHSYGHCYLHILVATLLPHIITITPLSLWLVVSGCTVIGPRGRGWPHICQQG